MIEKQIYELTSYDLKQYPVWYFPMDDTVEDELTIRPFKGEGIDYQIIIRTYFIASDNKEYVGYIYWNRPSNIADVQPVLYVNDEECITFWSGVVEASWDDYGDELKELRNKFPFNYSSEAFQGLDSLSGKLEGLYYLDDKGNVSILK